MVTLLDHQSEANLISKQQLKQNEAFLQALKGDSKTSPFSNKTSSIDSSKSSTNGTLTHDFRNWPAVFDNNNNNLIQNRPPLKLFSNRPPNATSFNESDIGSSSKLPPMSLFPCTSRQSDQFDTDDDSIDMEMAVIFDKFHSNDNVNVANSSLHDPSTPLNHLNMTKTRNNILPTHTTSSILAGVENSKRSQPVKNSVQVTKQIPIVQERQPLPMVQVPQPLPMVQVAQPPPMVQVAQPPPMVQVSQPQPMVQVAQPIPTVQVAQPIQVAHSSQRPNPTSNGSGVSSGALPPTSLNRRLEEEETDDLFIRFELRYWSLFEAAIPKALQLEKISRLKTSGYRDELERIDGILFSSYKFIPIISQK